MIHYSRSLDHSHQRPNPLDELVSYVQCKNSSPVTTYSFGFQIFFTVNLLHDPIKLLKCKDSVFLSIEKGFFRTFDETTSCG
jgi:hypothetical protein